MNHNLESNFAFLKSLKSNKNIVNLKVNFLEADDPDQPYKIIYFKQLSDLHKLRNVRQKKIILTEYNKNKPTTNTILL